MDIGTDNIKVGFAYEKQPRFFIPTVIGYLEHNNIIEDAAYEKHVYIGNEALTKRGILKLKYPISDIIENWDGIKDIFQQIFFNLLEIHPNKHPLLITVAPYSPEENRNKLIRLLFESFNFPSIQVYLPQLLSVVALNKNTGCVVDLGAHTSHIIPIYKNSVIKDKMNIFNLGGYQVTNFLQNQLLRQRGYLLTSSSDRYIVKALKEKICYVALDIKTEEKKYQSKLIPTKGYKISPKDTIELGFEACLATECLFEPAIVGKSTPSLTDIIRETVESCDKEIRKKLYNSIILAGGTSMFPGLKERILKELKREKIPEYKLSQFKTMRGKNMKKVQNPSSKYPIHVLAPSNRLYSAWFGGAQLAAHMEFQKKFITKKQYNMVEMQKFNTYKI